MNIYRYALTLSLALLVAPLCAPAQSLTTDATGRTYTAERHLIESTLETIVAVIQETTIRQEGSGLGHRLHRITNRLTQAVGMMAPTPPNPVPADLAELRRLLHDVADDLTALRDELEEEGEEDLADRLRPIARDLRRAVEEADRLAETDPAEGRVRMDDGHRWLRPGRYDGDDEYEDRRDREEDRDEDNDWRDRDEDEDDDWRDRDEDEDQGDWRDRDEDEDQGDWHDRDEDEDQGDWRDRDEDEDQGDWRDRDEDQDQGDWRDRWRRNRWRHYAGTVVGEFSHRWPYRNETALYTTIPALRYNRAEGFVLGLGRQSLSWDDYGRARLYGQLGYAFALDEWRLSIGAEARLDNRRNEDFGLKIGGAYRFNTDTRDAWKTSWLENSLAAFFFENDFFDYYEVEGWTVYAVQRLTPFLQLSAGYRQDDYRSLANNTGWSLFDGDGFRINPAINEGRMQTLAFALEGGRVAGLHHLPSGAAFRFEAEVGEGLGGDFSFNRYVADGRVYVPVTRHSSLGLRLRGGLTDGDQPPAQKTFTLGGLGSVRAYAQNAFPGTRMLLANAEYAVEGPRLLDGLFDDLLLLGFFDAGWVNAFGTDRLDLDDVLPTAGIGLGLDERTIRLELAFPLRDFGGGKDPSLWLRITPSF